MSSAQESKEYALKSQIARQSGLKNFQHQIGNHTLNCLVDMWKIHLRLTRLAKEQEEELKENIWKYVKQNPAELWGRMNSKLFGIKTTIAEYTNKKGVKSLAHYTANGNYLATVKSLGETPVHYEGNFRITQEHFTICFDRLDRLEKKDGFYNITQIFKHNFERS
jgi:hypothetical protein